MRLSVLSGLLAGLCLSICTVVAQAAPDIRFSELHYDNVGTDAGEAIEVEGPAGADLTGYSIVLYNGNDGAVYSTTPLSGAIPAMCDGRGVLVTTYAVNGIQNGSPDGMALVDAAGQLVEFLSYEGTFTATNGVAAGILSTDIVAQESSAAVGQSLQRDASDRWTLTTSTLGACNVAEPPPPGNKIAFSGRSTSDPALPVGFQAQLFATLQDSSNNTIPSTFTWSSETPGVASVDQNGVITSLAEGTATFRATAAADGTTATYSLPTRIAVASTTAEYIGNTEFGEPQDGDASDDYIVRRPQYTTSYNSNRNTPNWVSYELDPTAYGAEDRCNCFTADPELPSTFTHLTTADYTGAGAAAGYGIDRGHLARSFDRTAGSLDNATTFLFSNIAPQAADMNQGPWAVLESDLGDLARFQDKEVYIVTGVAGNKGTVKNEGKIVIPTSFWKVAVIVPHNARLGDIRDYRDLEVWAVIMPNEPGIRNEVWESYRTTVDAIEQLSGYDLLALLPDEIEDAVESNTQPPLASLTAPASAAEGDTVSLSASESIDPNGSLVQYVWDFGDGSTGSGSEVTHVYTQDGVYTIRLVVTDNDGLTGAATRTITVTNVTPVVGAFPGATLRAGEVYTAAGSFTDPGTDLWTATVDWGDGTAAQQVSLTQRSFSLSHTYRVAGNFTVVVKIADDDSDANATQTVVVLAVSAAQTLGAAQQLLDDWIAARQISRAVGALLKAQIALAQKALPRHPLIAKAQLKATVAELNLLARVGLITAAQASALSALLRQAISTIN